MMTSIACVSILLWRTSIGDIATLQDNTTFIISRTAGSIFWTADSHRGHIWGLLFTLWCVKNLLWYHVHVCIPGRHYAPIVPFGPQFGIIVSDYRFASRHYNHPAVMRMRPFPIKSATDMPTASALIQPNASMPGLPSVNLPAIRDA